MVELVVHDVIVRILREVRWPGPSVQRRVLLKEKDGDRLLHLWAGTDDGDAVALQAAEKQPARPMIYDITAQTMTLGGLAVDRAIIADSDTVATLWVREANGDECALDMNPTDAINLALRFRAPILTEAAVLDEAGIPAGELLQTLEAEELEFQHHLGDHLPPDMQLAFPTPERLEWRSIVPPEWRLIEPTQSDE
ncbi:MAG: bifunctional nuclease family protein [Anaerolineales bacterium]